MKFYSSALSELIKKIEQNTIKALLLHGNNQGFISSVVSTLSKKLNLCTSTLVFKNLSPESLILASNSQNFFMQRELIKITEVTSVLSKSIKDALMSNKFEHFVCFISKESLPNSGIRKFFEDHSDLASLGCYYDTEQTISKLVLQQCRKRNKSIDDDALYYLKSHLKVDHQIIKSELKKLFYFTHDKELITKDDVICTLSNDLLVNSDSMCIAFAKKDFVNFIKELQKLQNHHKNEVLIIRSLIRYYLNIYSVALSVEDGQSIDYAMKSLQPPVFFKYASDFKQVVNKHSSTDALRFIRYLQEAEKSYKINPKCFDLFSVICSVQGAGAGDCSSPKTLFI